jgi:hypothetical protein
VIFDKILRRSGFFLTPCLDQLTRLTHVELECCIDVDPEGSSYIRPSKDPATLDLKQETSIRRRQKDSTRLLLSREASRGYEPKQDYYFLNEYE